MQVNLQVDRREEFSFRTFRGTLGPYRSLEIRIDGRPFTVWYMLDGFRMDDERYLQNVDDRLAHEFETMIGRLLTVAAKMVPEGINLTTATDEEIRDALAKATWWQRRNDAASLTSNAGK